MKLYYRTSNGDVFYAVLDKDLFGFVHNTNVPLSTLEVDEVSPNNQTLYLDLRKTQLRVNAAGRSKYYISAGQIFQRENWVDTYPLPRA